MFCDLVQCGGPRPGGLVPGTALNQERSRRSSHRYCRTVLTQYPNCLFLIVDIFLTKNFVYFISAVEFLCISDPPGPRYKSVVYHLFVNYAFFSPQGGHTRCLLVLLHCKIMLTIFPSPAGMSLTKVSLDGSLVSDITAGVGTGKWQTFFYSVGG